MSRDVIDLARNVKKEADAIQELNSTLRRQQNSSGKKHASSHSVERNDESREMKVLRRRIKELEAKVAKYEDEISKFQQKVDVKNKKVTNYLRRYLRWRSTLTILKEDIHKESMSFLMRTGLFQIES